VAVLASKATAGRQQRQQHRSCHHQQQQQLLMMRRQRVQRRWRCRLPGVWHAGRQQQGLPWVWQQLLKLLLLLGQAQ
jgi:hypothetical protein